MKNDLANPVPLGLMGFGMTTVLFWLLAIEHWFRLPAWFGVLTGLEGIICGISAINLAVAEVLEESPQN